MKSIDIQLKKTEVITDISCDICGKSCKVHESTINNDMRLDNGEKTYAFEYMSLTANWGYDSNKDMEQWTAQICEDCVDMKLPFIKFQKTEL